MVVAALLRVRRRVLLVRGRYLVVDRFVYDLCSFVCVCVWRVQLTHPDKRKRLPSVTVHGLGAATVGYVPQIVLYCIYIERETMFAEFLLTQCTVSACSSAIDIALKIQEQSSEPVEFVFYFFQNKNSFAFQTIQVESIYTSSVNELNSLCQTNAKSQVTLDVETCSVALHDDYEPVNSALPLRGIFRALT